MKARHARTLQIKTHSQKAATSMAKQKHDIGHQKRLKRQAAKNGTSTAHDHLKSLVARGLAPKAIFNLSDERDVYQERDR